jgi:hypothetical protein
VPNVHSLFFVPAASAFCARGGGLPVLRFLAEQLHSSVAMAVYADDPRTGDILTEGSDGDLVLVGFPSDEGVALNGGRVGAAGGPAAFRR